MSTEPKDLETYREYLTTLARARIPLSLRSRLDASDIVQDTLIEAVRHIQDGSSEQIKSPATWLRRILKSNLIDAIRQHSAQKRDHRREQVFASQLEESAIGLERLCYLDQSTPSSRLNHEEQTLRIARALAALPENQRRAIELRYSQGASLADISAQLGRSTLAVAGLLKRGLSKLRETLGKQTHGDYSMGPIRNE